MLIGRNALAAVVEEHPEEPGSLLNKRYDRGIIVPKPEKLGSNDPCKDIRRISCAANLAWLGYMPMHDAC